MLPFLSLTRTTGVCHCSLQSTQRHIYKVNKSSSRVNPRAAWYTREPRVKHNGGRTGGLWRRPRPGPLALLGRSCPTKRSARLRRALRHGSFVGVTGPLSTPPESLQLRAVLAITHIFFVPAIQASIGIFGNFTGFMIETNPSWRHCIRIDVI